MNPIASTLNRRIKKNSPQTLNMLSRVGRSLFFPKGIITQSAEAGEKAYRINAAAGIAMENKDLMYFGSLMAGITGVSPKNSLSYAPSFGIPELRKKWRHTLFEKNPSLAGKTISLPVVTSGITHAVSLVSELFVDPDDPVIIPEMMWGNYNMIFRVRNQARFLQYTMFSDAGFNLSGFRETVKTAAGEHPKIIVLLNFPHNPSGYTLTKSEAEAIVEILLAAAESGTRVIAACDDSYFGLFYGENIIKESMFARLADRHERLLAIKMDGATKENFAWGLRVGFVTYGIHAKNDYVPVYHALERKTAGCVRGNISSASHLGQSLLLKSMNDPSNPAERREKFDILAKRAGRAREVAGLPKYRHAWSVYPFNSGYFLCIRLKEADAETLRVHLLEQYGVGLISLGKTDLRVAFSCVEVEQIPEVFDTILAAAESLQSRESDAK